MDFAHAGVQAGLADHRRLLVARHAGDGDGAAEQVFVGFAEKPGVVAHVRQQSGGDAEDTEQLIVPGMFVDVEELGAAGVGGVGCVHAAAGEPPEQETVDGAKGELTVFGTGSGAFHMVEDPGEFGGRKIGIEQQSGAVTNLAFAPIRAQLCAKTGGTAILPDDGVVDGCAGLPVPYERRFRAGW